MQKFRQVIDVVDDSKSLSNDGSDTRAGPQFCRESVCLSTFKQNCLEFLPTLEGQLRRPSRNTLRPKHPHSAFSSRLAPAFDAPSLDPHHSRNLRHLHTFVEQLHRSSPP